MGLLLGSFFILFVSFLTFLPSFNLALFGDDWLAFFRYLTHLGPTPTQHWTYLSYFLTPYGSQDILMGLLHKIFGFDGSYYQITSFVFRLIAAFSLYPIVMYLTKSKLATFFAILFFAITTTGIETTNWVFNMPSYITIALFNLFLYFFVKAREDKKYLSLVISTALYYFAYITTPIRMHGSLLFILLLEFFWIIQKKDFGTIKKAVLRFSIILFVFLIIKFTGQSLGPPNEPIERFKIGITTDLQLLNKGRFDFIFYPIIIFGGMFFPGFVLPLQWQVQSVITLIFNILTPAFLIFLLITVFIVNFTKNATSDFLKKIILSSLLWSLVIILIYKQNINYLSNAVYLFLLAFGGYFLILFLFLLIKLSVKQEGKDVLKSDGFGIFTPLAWTFLSFFFAWWWVPETVFPSYQRYLIVSAVGISMLFASIISLGKKFKNQLILSLVLSPFLILHLASTNYYLRIIESYHSKQITEKIWGSIPHIPAVGKEPMVFYFEGGIDNFMILHNVITFGFSPHMQLLYNLKEQDPAPVPMTNWQEVVSAVKDGQSFKAYGYPLKPIPVNNVYGFYLQGKDNLINITDMVRKKLVEEK